MPIFLAIVRFQHMQDYKLEIQYYQELICNLMKD
jgi:hypothetical protein